MKDLSLVGEARPCPRAALDKRAEEHSIEWPPTLRGLLERWGAGTVCGIVTLTDPADDAAWREQQRLLHTFGRECHTRGHWGDLAPGVFERLVVLGTDRAGLALVIGRESHPLMLLHPRGYTLWVGNFDRMVDEVFLGGHYERLRLAIFEGRHHGNYLLALTDKEFLADLGVPAVYRVGASAAVPAVVDALVRGNEAEADVALQALLATEVALYGLLDLAAALSAERGAAVARELRASYFEQVEHLVLRRAPFLRGELPLAETKSAILADSGLEPEKLDRFRVNSVLDRPEGIFVEPQPAWDPVRATAPVANALQRGFVLEAGRPPVLGDRRIEAHLAAWFRDDPGTSIASSEADRCAPRGASPGHRGAPRSSRRAHQGRR